MSRAKNEQSDQAAKVDVIRRLLKCSTRAAVFRKVQAKYPDDKRFSLDALNKNMEPTRQLTEDQSTELLALIGLPPDFPAWTSTSKPPVEDGRQLGVAEWFEREVERFKGKQRRRSDLADISLDDRQPSASEARWPIYVELTFGDTVEPLDLDENGFAEKSVRFRLRRVALSINFSTKAMKAAFASRFGLKKEHKQAKPGVVFDARGSTGAPWWLIEAVPLEDNLKASDRPDDPEPPPSLFSFAVEEVPLFELLGGAAGDTVAASLSICAKEMALVPDSPELRDDRTSISRAHRQIYDALEKKDVIPNSGRDDYLLNETTHTLRDALRQTSEQ